MLGDVGHDLGDQARLERRTPTRSAGPVIARSTSSGDSGVITSVPAAEQLADAAVAERAVVEVGAQRDHDPQPARGVVDGGGERVEEGAGRRSSAPG